MATALPEPLVDDPRLFVLSNVVVWIVIGVVIGTVSFDQGILWSAIPAAVGGVTSGIVLRSSLVHGRGRDRDR
jgi:membrane associated rhomboid family serine protease